MTATTARSVCPLDCPDRCSLTVRVDGGRVVGLDGSHDHPRTDGYICGKVRKFAEHRVHAPHRLLRPLVRVGPRGPGARFEPVAWDEAILLVADRLRAIVAEHGGEAIWPYWYAGSNGWLTGGAMDLRLWRRLGASKTLRTLCAANTGAGARAVYGGMRSADPLDVEHAALVVIWGFNPSASGIHWVPAVRRAKANGAKLVVVDPRVTPLAREADLHLAPLPGTDVALALAVAGVALAEGLADAAFLDRWCDGVDTFRAACAEWPVERAAATCGVGAADIRALAALWAERRDGALLRAGWGLERSRNGTDAVRAVLSLPAVFGAFGRPGAGYVMSTSPGPRVDPERWLGVVPDPGTRALNMSQLGRLLDETRDPPIRALYVYDCNPVATVPDQARVVRALERPDLFVVVHEQVHTDTVDYADVVLPATTFLEHHEVSYGYGGYATTYAAPAVPPVGESRSNHQVAVALARALGFGDEPAFRDTEVELAAQIAAAAGVPFEALRERGVVVGPRPVQFVDTFPGGGTAPGPARVQLAIGGAPAYRPPPADAGRPLSLISPSSTRAISSTLFETLPTGSATIGLHPDDAAARGIAAGDVVAVTNDQGRVELVAELDPTLRPGVVRIAKGVWRAGTRNGFTANALIPDHVDERGGGACYNDARVDVVKL